MSWKPVKPENSPIPGCPTELHGLVLHEKEVDSDIYEEVLEKVREDPRQIVVAFESVKNKLFHWVEGSVH